MFPWYYPKLKENDFEDEGPDTERKPKQIEMPDGTIGYVCLKCSKYFAHVESNHENGYICFDCRFWSIK